MGLREYFKTKGIIVKVKSIPLKCQTGFYFILQGTFGLPDRLHETIIFIQIGLKESSLGIWLRQGIFHMEAPTPPIIKPHKSNYGKLHGKNTFLSSNIFMQHTPTLSFITRHVVWQINSFSSFFNNEQFSNAFMGLGVEFHEILRI